MYDSSDVRLDMREVKRTNIWVNVDISSLTDQSINNTQHNNQQHYLLTILTTLSCSLWFTGHDNN